MPSRLSVALGQRTPTPSPWPGTGPVGNRAVEKAGKRAKLHLHKQHVHETISSPPPPPPLHKAVKVRDLCFGEHHCHSLVLKWPQWEDCLHDQNYSSKIPNRQLMSALWVPRHQWYPEGWSEVDSQAMYDLTNWRQELRTKRAVKIHDFVIKLKWWLTCIDNIQFDPHAHVKKCYL